MQAQVLKPASRPRPPAAATQHWAARPAPQRCAQCRVTVVGIDLGTSNSAVAVFERGQGRVLPDESGRHTLPSVVSYTQDEVLVGEAAQQRAATHAADTFYSVKRLMGRSPGQVAHFSGQLAYGTAPSPCGSRLQLPCPALGRALDPEEVSAEVLRALVQRAQRHLDDDVTQAVITVPAHFTPQQRAATQRAAQLAGIQQASLLQEPVAAAMAYGFGKPTDAETILAFDLGGGTFDVSVLESFEGIMEVISTGGDSFLGGDDFSRLFAEHLLSRRLDAGTYDAICRDAAARAALLAGVEAAKGALSSADGAALRVPELGIEVSVSRAEFEAAAAPLLARLGPPLATVAADSKTALALPLSALSGHGVAAGAEAPLPPSGKFAPKPRQLTAVVLVGAATRTPAVRTWLRSATGLEPRSGVDPEQCVAIGAAIQAGVFMGLADGLELMDGSYVAAQHGKAAGFQM